MGIGHAAAPKSPCLLAQMVPQPEIRSKFSELGQTFRCQGTPPEEYQYLNI